MSTSTVAGRFGASAARRGWTGRRLSAGDPVVVLGRAALVTQGVLYGIVGFLAVAVARGHQGAQPSQKGAIEAIAHRPYGRVLLIVMAVGLLTHVVWRLALAWRGEPGDEDGGSAVRRAANVGRAAVYVGFLAVAIRLLTKSGGGSSGGGTKKSTATVLTWPAGPLLVVIVGAVVVGVGGWNIWKGLARKFEDDLDLGRLGSRGRKLALTTGAVGFVARGIAFGLVGWFLIQAGLAKDADRSEGLDGALRNLARTDHGPGLLLLVATGLVLFGAYRILDGWLRKPSEVAHT